MDSAYFSFVLFLVHFLPSDAVEKEPTCSKFPYEEQLLGKMTRVEVKVEQWDKELKRFEESILSVLEHRREELQNIVEVQNVKMKTFSEEYKTFRDEIVKSTTERPATKIVAFNAYLTTSGAYTENQLLKFPHILLNEGDGYDATSGYFTAPISGLYQFTAHVCNSGNQYMAYSIVYGETIVARSAVYEDNSVVCASVGAVVKMQADERVCVKSMYNKNHLYSNQYRWPSFTGVLLHT